MDLSSKTEYNCQTSKMLMRPTKSWIQIQKTIFESRNQTCSRFLLRCLIVSILMMIGTVLNYQLYCLMIIACSECNLKRIGLRPAHRTMRWKNRIVSISTVLSVCFLIPYLLNNNNTSIASIYRTEDDSGRIKKQKTLVVTVNGLENDNPTPIGSFQPNFELRI